MKNTKLERVPVIEDTMALSLTTLLDVSKKTGSNLLAVTWQGRTGLVMLEAVRMTLMFNGVIVSAEIAAVPCLKGRLRPLLKCPRAHEGNFQSLYYRGGELACRICHALRYRSNLASSSGARERIAREKLIMMMGGRGKNDVPSRAVGAWRKKYIRQLALLEELTRTHVTHLVELFREKRELAASVALTTIEM
jgi:hypothetical protein